MIYTLTCNPSIDYFLNVHELNKGELNRAETVTLQPGGKGINISRVMKRFGQDSVALGFTGGFTGEWITAFLNKEDIKTDFVQIDYDSRINVKLVGKEETEINAAGPRISNNNISKLIQTMDRFIEGDLLVVAGSIHKGMQLSRIFQICKEKRIKLVVDAEAELLKQALFFQPYLIKPNQQELEDFFECSFSNMNDAIPYCRKLVNMGAKNVIFSMGSSGALYANKNALYKAYVPKGEVVHTIGAGDSMVAAFLTKIQLGYSRLAAFRFSVAAGSAAAYSEELCNKQSAFDLIGQVTVTKVEEDVN
ncbi:1-phosphofructokinase [Cytobacillus horneckiae]|uniref:1-phosphofructokinase n=1 Tax=Cytobacillus horneckiae TaxID=549687 RepID=UPI003D9AAB41